MMSKKKIIRIELTEDEFFALKNIINEACFGIRIDNYENIFGKNEQIVISFSENISNKILNGNLLVLSETELQILVKSITEVFRQIDDWKFQTRIGISKNEAMKIKTKVEEEYSKLPYKQVDT